MLTGAHTRLRHSLDLPSRIKAAITGAPAKWLGGALIAGFGASFLFRQDKKKPAAKAAAVKKERGFLLGLLTLVFTLSKPAVKIYATKLLKDYLSRRLTTGAQGSPRVMRTPPY
jgi:hypothetical protein